MAKRGVGESLEQILARRAEEAAKKSVYRLASHLAGRVRQTIIGQEQRWHPLSPRYAAWKQRNKLDPRILRATGEYVNSIQVRHLPDQKAYMVAPGDGPHKNIVYRGNQTPLWKIGAWLEYGTRKMPARPHWRPVWNEAKLNMEELKKRFAEDVGWVIRQEIVDYYKRNPPGGK